MFVNTPMVEEMPEHDYQVQLGILYDIIASAVENSAKDHDYTEILYDVKNNMLYVQISSFIKIEHEHYNRPPDYIDTVGWAVVQIRKADENDLKRIEKLRNGD